MRKPGTLWAQAEGPGAGMEEARAARLEAFRRGITGLCRQPGQWRAQWQGRHREATGKSLREACTSE